MYHRNFIRCTVAGLALVAVAFSWFKSGFKPPGAFVGATGVPSSSRHRNAANKVSIEVLNPSRHLVEDFTLTPTAATLTTETANPTITIETNYPSVSPNASPTKHPSPAPSSRAPSSKPTDKPTNDPTKSPVTSNPTNEPSMFPTLTPTDDPTQEPTADPTKSPVTSNPTHQPSMFPTFTPTDDPTQEPSADPTKSPVTSKPTNEPSKIPTSEPSNHPTQKPTKKPTKLPTSVPTNKPTRMPTPLPTSIPTRRPTQKPTRRPTRLPTRLPSKRPSLKPTMTPTTTPTYFPSGSPTLEPSGSPTLNPTRSPSRRPTQQPSMKPTKKPSYRPSATPTRSPSLRPTRLPTKRPTRVPTRVPTLSPTTKPTVAPTTRPPTKKPTARPSATPTSVPTNKPSQIPSVSGSLMTNNLNNPTTAPTYSLSVAPSRMPSIEPTNTPTESPSYMPTDSIPTDSPTMLTGQPSTSYLILHAVLSFNFPLNEPIKNITTLETTIEKFLGDKLLDLIDLDGLIISHLNVTVISQDIKFQEPRRSLLESDSYLFVTTSVEAQASPPEIAGGFLFQAEAHSIITEHSEELYKAIYISTLKHEASSSDEMKIVDISTSNPDTRANKLKMVAMGSSIAGVVVLVSLLALLTVKRRRGNSRGSEEESRDNPPPTTFANTYRKPEEEVSSIEDSFLSAEVQVYPKNAHHNAEQPDQSFGSLGDNFPVLLEEDLQHTNPHDLESNLQPIENDDSSLKMVTFVATDETSQIKAAKPCIDESTNPPAMDDELYEPDPSLERLYEKSMPVDEEETDFNENAIHAPSKAPKPKQGHGFKLFSCFADNTFTEDKPAINGKDILRAQYRSNSHSVTNLHANHNVYEVRAPPGPLGIVIDTSTNGPYVHDIKATSPLNGQIEKGDMILSIDGWNCEQTSAHDVANWIKKKPLREEQVLVLKGKPQDYADEDSV